MVHVTLRDIGRIFRSNRVLQAVALLGLMTGGGAVLRGLPNFRGKLDGSDSFYTENLAQGQAISEC